MRRALALVLALALVVGACSKDERPTIERVTGRIGASGSGGSTDASGTGSDGTGGAAGTAGGDAGGAAGGTTGTGSASTGGSGGAGADAVARQAAAEAVLNAYFDALEAQDFGAAQRASTGAPQFMARVREVVNRYNTERDGTTQLSYTTRSFQVASNEATSVAYMGSAQLDSTVSGPAGDPQKESALFEHPVVSLVNGSWRVAAYMYDGQPLDLAPSTSSKEVGGVDFRLQGALSFGTSTGLVIDLVTDNDHGLKVEGVQLTYADGTSSAPKLSALISKKPAALYYLFDRRASRPTAWTATVTIDAGTKDEAKATVTLKL